MKTATAAAVEKPRAVEQGFTSVKLTSPNFVLEYSYASNGQMKVEIFARQQNGSVLPISAFLVSADEALAFATGVCGILGYPGPQSILAGAKKHG